MTNVETLLPTVEVPGPSVHSPMLPPADPPPASSLTLDFLEWIATRPRTYTEALDAWRTHCPRFTIWEDAFADGLVRLERGPRSPMSEARVLLTSRGQQVLTSRR